PSGPLPAPRSGVTSTPRAAHGAGSLATTNTRASAAARNRSSCRSAIARPPTFRKGLATPPSRFAGPPAMIAPATFMAAPARDSPPGLSGPRRVLAARNVLEDAHDVAVDAAVRRQHAPGLAVEGTAVEVRRLRARAA